MTDNNYKPKMEFTVEESSYLNQLSQEWEDHLDDGWRCDFCEPGCTCDSDYLDELIEKFISRYPRWKDSRGTIWNEI